MTASDTGGRRNRQELTPVADAALLADLVDELIPGDNHWPSASSVGVHGLVAVRLAERAGEPVLGRIVDAVLAAGGPFADRPPEERVAIMERFEAAEPALFEQVRVASTFAYYESPFVVAAIRRLGRPYALRPHLTGYPSRPFDFETDTPRHDRGAYIATDAVRRVDVSGLQLDETRTARWGLER